VSLPTWRPSLRRNSRRSAFEGKIQLDRHILVTVNLGSYGLACSSITEVSDVSNPLGGHAIVEIGSVPNPLRV
jgi:hypothetical protein